jgi:hypothetical protein
LFNGASSKEMNDNNVEEDARRCVILAVRVPTIINFEEVLDLNAIKYLQEVIITLYHRGYR